MTQAPSEFVLDNLCCFIVLCDKSTAKRAVALLLATASASLVKAVGELILNVREKIPKVVRDIFTNSKISLKKKRTALAKYWKLLGPKLAPLVHRFHGNVKGNAPARNTGAVADKKVTSPDK